MWKIILKCASFVFACFPRCSLNSAFIERRKGKGSLRQPVGPAVAQGGLGPPDASRSDWALSQTPIFRLVFLVGPRVWGTVRPRAAMWG